MNFPTSDMHSFWDVSTQQPDSFSALPDDDFLAFLQKHPDGIDPQSITNVPPPNFSPPSSDSSPSPPSTHNESISRRQSGVFNGTASSGADSPQQDDASLKRKASNDNDDEPQHKSQHTSPSNAGTKKTTSSSSARRKSGGHQDETRLLKRKEQNRAAQRAFRERKEKHVRDLEDKVAALEAKNQLTEQENENLRDLLQRLQSENMMLKQAAFTFTAPRSNNAPAPQHSFNGHPVQFNFSSPGAGPSKSPMQAQSPPSHYDINFNSLISFDPSMINPNEDLADQPMDTSFSYNTNHYKTIASNPMFTSFVEPSPADSPPIMMNGNQGYTQSPFDSFADHWTPPEGGGHDALDQLFGGNFLSSSGTGAPDFQALLASPPSALSPVSHTTRTPSLSSSSSPAAATNGSSPGSMHGTGECPKTKEQLSKCIEQQGPSSFVQGPGGSSQSDSPAAGNNNNGADKMHVDSGPSCEMPFAPFLRKSHAEDGVTPFVMCRGSSFPKTQKSDKNIEVLTAWRTITSNPQFKDVDINELCTEFTSKARCDGTKVVLEPEGVHHIIEALAQRQSKKQ
ncbi:hypothetical protein C8Q80DRAFT_1265487 [Daedaleopsis nitida]|nr:hypothetical protein C8Q80DRAFT_1265487 [Daedaleopsis nitida]